MKVAFDAKRIFCNRTGLGNYGRTLVLNYREAFPLDEISLFTPYMEIPFLQGDDECHNVKVKMPDNIYTRKFHSLWRMFHLCHDIEKVGPDIYHGLSHELPIGIDDLPHTKSVVTIHDLIYLRYPHYFPFIDRLIYDVKFKMASEKSDGIIAICQQTADDLVEFFGVDAKKIEVIHQSIDPLFFRKSSPIEKERVVKKFNLPKEFVLFVGTLEERKNPMLIIEAMRQLKKRISFPLVLVGNGKKYKQKMVELAKDYGLEKEIYFLGHVEFNDLPILYQLSSLFVFPSFFEGFGLPVVEALASGVPVITSKGSSFPEAGGDAAQFIDPEDAEDLAFQIEKVLTNEALRFSMVEKGHEHVKNFNGSNLSNRLKNYYLKIIGQ